MSKYETIIGLEIHAQLNTETKMFCNTPQSYGAEPNTSIGVVDSGQPGSLPVVNKEAVSKALQLGIALNAQIDRTCQFDRKSYFYPDCPRNYQITQYYKPIIKNGTLTFFVDNVEHKMLITQAHLEDDAGTLRHFSNFTGVDLNRAGTPLIEIVSSPTLYSAKEASAYAKSCRLLLQYLDISDCNMDEGSFRMDVNISVRKKGEKELRNKIEIKNMNSFSFMELAIEKEVARQIELYENNPSKSFTQLVPQETFRFDIEKKTAVSMRVKETAADYRYFPEPDLPPLNITQEEIDALNGSLPELPQHRVARYKDKLSLTPSVIELLIQNKELSDYFDEAVESSKHPIVLSNWLTVEVIGQIKESGKTLKSSGILPHHIAELVDAIVSNSITGKIGKKVVKEMIHRPGVSPQEIIDANPSFKPIVDIEEIRSIVISVLEEYPLSIVSYKDGNTKAFHFLIGMIMKKTGGKADPIIVNKQLTDLLSQ